MRLDEFLPVYDFRERHDIFVRAEPKVIYEAIQELDLRRSLVVRTLFALRSLPGLLRRSQGTRLGLTLQDLLASGFTVLAEEPPNEFVFGIVGRFWRVSGGRVAVPATEFAAFAEPGYAKAAANFRVEAEGVVNCRLSTETRIFCTDSGARRRFRIYWLIVRPFSGLVRRAMLRSIRDAAERGGSGPAASRWG